MWGLCPLPGSPIMLRTHWDITATPKSPAESGFPQKILDASLVIVMRGVSKSYKFKTNPKIKKARNFHSLIKWYTVSISSSYCEKWNTQSLLFRYENRWLVSANVKCFHILFTCFFYFFDFLKLGLYHNILNNVI